MSNELIIFNEEDLQNNPKPRVAICLCLDTSSSMNSVYNSTTRIAALQEGMELFFREIKEDAIAKDSAEISIVSFNNAAQCLLPFANIERQEVPSLYANGMTDMGNGVNMALDLLENRKQEYKNNGIDYYQPWLVIMSDGEPNGEQSVFDQAVNRAIRLEANSQLVVMPIAIGGDDAVSGLSNFSNKRQPAKLDGIKFREFFQWLSASISRVSASQVGDKVDLPNAGGWASI